MSTVAGMIAARTPPEASRSETAVALGYDRIRFVKPVFLGDTVTTHYRVHGGCRTSAPVPRSGANQDGTLVAVASHARLGAEHPRRRIGDGRPLRPDEAAIAHRIPHIIRIVRPVAALRGRPD